MKFYIRKSVINEAVIEYDDRITAFSHLRNECIVAHYGNNSPKKETALRIIADHFVECNSGDFMEYIDDILNQDKVTIINHDIPFKKYELDLKTFQKLNHHDLEFLLSDLTVSCQITIIYRRSIRVVSVKKRIECLLGNLENDDSAAKW